VRLVILSTVLSLLGGVLSPGMLAAETCVEWVAKAVSVQGNVEVRRAGEAPWTQVQWRDTFCPGDIIRVRERSRLAIVAQNGSNYRLDENTTITITQPEPKQTFLLNLRAGAAYFFSRLPRSLKVITPFANAGVEGTEFFVKVERDQTFLLVFEGRVAVTNPAGSLTLASGQSAIAKAEQAPALRMVVRPRDAVQWALYYPPIIDFRPADFPGEAAWQALVRQSIAFYWQGDLPSAFASIAAVPSDIRDLRFFTYRAALLLTVGRVEEARLDIERALALEPRNSHALALQAIIAVAQNRKDEALQLATKAVELEPTSSAARVALSYAQQARFDLQGALASLKAAVTLPPENALAWARLAELWLSVGNLKRALNAAHRASALNSQVARTHTVLGFAFLTQIKIRNAKNTFERAIQLDQTDPLSRLGLGLAQIRQGKLKEGRGEIEIAASLDPNNSLIRSYLGKAYFEEKRDKLARNQFATAKALDPQDPTPWFYDAIRKQTVNRPVEALQDLQKSIELNDNRAVYRSRLLLDEDLAVRSASLGRIYNDLGFQQLALVEGWKSLNIDPSNYSAHRFLADVYSALPDHEIARVSEILQSQLLQPINITPVPPQLVESDLFILQKAGPADSSFNEFNPLFNRNRLALQANGIVGGNSTFGDEVVQSGVWGKVSYSLGQFHFETDGFRENNDLKQNIYNAFAQVSLSHKTGVQAEFRYTDNRKGDLELRFDPDNFSSTLRQKERIDSIRLGFRHAFTPHSDIIASFIYRSADFDVSFRPGRDFISDEDGFIVEVRHLFQSERFHITSGVGHFDADRKDVINFAPSSPMIERAQLRHTNLYTYGQINYPKNVTWTIGGSADFLEGAIVDRDQVNPKFGLTWKLLPTTTLRAAVFRVLTRTLISSQTIEPTQVAGFNQFFFDPEGTESWRYGIGIDQKFSVAVYGGVEFSKRELEVPFLSIVPPAEVRRYDWEEYLVRTYLYWTPLSWLAASGEYRYERLNRDEFGGPGDVTNLRTHWLSPAINFFHPSGFSVRLKVTYINQEGEFGNPAIGMPIAPGDDRFWVADAFIGYRLPKRWGLITLGVRNLFDEEFKFQDRDPANPLLFPERLFFSRLTLAF
jgi:tetratricopeptide (TPR) repeat protein